MDRRRAIAALPHPYAVALRLHDAGATADAVACTLGIDPASVPMTLEVGRAKLASLLRTPEAGSVNARSNSSAPPATLA